MPTYEYECVECGHRFEAFQAMSDDPLQECEHCSGPVKRLIFGGTGIIFKGSGFYVNDSSKAGKQSTLAAAKGAESEGGSEKSGQAQSSSAQSSSAQKSSAQSS